MAESQMTVRHGSCLVVKNGKARTKLLGAGPRLYLLLDVCPWKNYISSIFSSV